MHVRDDVQSVRERGHCLGKRARKKEIRSRKGQETVGFRMVGKSGTNCETNDSIKEKSIGG